MYLRVMFLYLTADMKTSCLLLNKSSQSSKGHRRGLSDAAIARVLSIRRKIAVTFSTATTLCATNQLTSLESPRLSY